MEVLNTNIIPPIIPTSFSGTNSPIRKKGSRGPYKTKAKLSKSQIEQLRVFIQSQRKDNPSKPIPWKKFIQKNPSCAHLQATQLYYLAKQHKLILPSTRSSSSSSHKNPSDIPEELISPLRQYITEQQNQHPSTTISWIQFKEQHPSFSNIPSGKIAQKAQKLGLIQNQSTINPKKPPFNKCFAYLNVTPPNDSKELKHKRVEAIIKFGDSWKKDFPHIRIPWKLVQQTLLLEGTNRKYASHTYGNWQSKNRIEALNESK